jgi:hypothetical protein
VGVSFVLRLWRCGFLDVRFATGFALEGVKISQPAKAQRFPNEPHWSGAADASRPLERRPLRVRTQHKTLRFEPPSWTNKGRKGDMRWQHYGHLDGGLIVGNETLPAASLRIWSELKSPPKKTQPVCNARPFWTGNKRDWETDRASRSNEQRAGEPHVLTFGLSEAELLIVRRARHPSRRSGHPNLRFRLKSARVDR